jgi:hypothetical protein
MDPLLRICSFLSWNLGAPSERGGEARTDPSREVEVQAFEHHRELTTFCELFAQLRETAAAQCTSMHEFIDRVQLLVHLNAIASGSIADRSHLRLTQIGPKNTLIVDTIQNYKGPVKSTSIGNQLANAE